MQIRVGMSTLPNEILPSVLAFLDGRSLVRVFSVSSDFRLAAIRTLKQCMGQVRCFVSKTVEYKQLDQHMGQYMQDVTEICGKIFTFDHAGAAYACFDAHVRTSLESKAWDSLATFSVEKVGRLAGLPDQIHHFARQRRCSGDLTGFISSHAEAKVKMTWKCGEPFAIRVQEDHEFGTEKAIGLGPDSDERELNAMLGYDDDDYDDVGCGYGGY